jgi:hypothetical protein
MARKRVRPDADDKQKGANMSVQEGTIEFFLKKTISYAHEGQTKEAQFLELREPQMIHLRHSAKLKQMVTRATIEMATKLKDQGVEPDTVVAGTELKKAHEVSEEEYGADSDQNAEAVQMALMMSADVDLAEFVETFGKMACQKKGDSVCLLDGEQPMTDALWMKMSPEDAVSAAVKWASFFAMPDALLNSR